MEPIKKLVNVTNHNLSDDQLADAKKNLFLEEVMELPLELKKLWANIPTDDTIEEHLVPLEEWLEVNTSRKDILVVQGETGATYQLVSFLQLIDRTVVHATTTRESVETVVDGKTIKRSVFKHCMFRQYSLFNLYYTKSDDDVRQ